MDGWVNERGGIDTQQAEVGGPQSTGLALLSAQARASPVSRFTCSMSAGFGGAMRRAPPLRNFSHVGRRGYYTLQLLPPAASSAEEPRLRRDATGPDFPLQAAFN